MEPDGTKLPATWHKVGGENDGSIRRVYQRYGYPKEKRAALDAWADYIEPLVRRKLSSH